MKTRFLHLLSAFAFVGFSSATLAVQVIMEDVSNKIITCDHAIPLLSTLPPGDCLAEPDATLMMTVTLETNENPNLLDNIHVIVQSNGQSFQYNTRSDATKEGSKRWKKLSVGGLGTVPFTASFHRGPFDTDKSSIIRYVSLDGFYLKKGAKVYVGVRANDTAGFAKDSVKKAFEVSF